MHFYEKNSYKLNIFISILLQKNLGQTIKGGLGNMIPYDHTIHEHIIQQGKEKRKQINPYVIEKIKRVSKLDIVRLISSSTPYYPPPFLASMLY